MRNLILEFPRNNSDVIPPQTPRTTYNPELTAAFYKFASYLPLYDRRFLLETRRGNGFTLHDTFPFSLIFDTCTEAAFPFHHFTLHKSRKSDLPRERKRGKFNYHFQTYQINVQHDVISGSWINFSQIGKSRRGDARLRKKA